MSYTTTSDFGSYALKSLRHLATSETAVVSRYLNIAQGVIHAKIKSVHEELPLEYPDELIKYCERTICEWMLITVEGYPVGNNFELMQSRYVEVVGENGFLDQIRDGLINLPDTVDSTPHRPKVTNISPTVQSGASAYVGNDGNLYVY